MTDLVNHPSHYKLANGVEVIDLTEQLSFNRGNAVKYLARAGRKDGASELQDLEKAAWYVQREIQRLAAVVAPAAEDEHNAWAPGCRQRRPGARSFLGSTCDVCASGSPQDGAA